MRLISLRVRIALLSALTSGLILSALAAASWYWLYQQKVAGIDTEIRALGTRHPGWLGNRANFDRLNTSIEFVFGEEHKGRVILLVKDSENKTLYVSAGWPEELPPATIDCALDKDSAATSQRVGTGSGRGFGPGRGGGQILFNRIPRFVTARTGASSWRLGIMGNDELRLVVGLNYNSVQVELNRMRNLFLASLPLALLSVGLGGWWIAGRALRPLKTIARTAEQVTARGLDQRIPASDEDPEITVLIQVLNRMMDRLEASFRQASRFSADASHELKTPLAIMQGELENAIQALPPASAEQRVLSNLLEETQKLKRITSNLLLLAQADSGQLKLSLEDIPFSEELEAMVEDAQIFGSAFEIRFNADIPPGVKLKGDRGLLRMALLNLIKNAVYYNEPNGSVSLTLVPGEEIELIICNTGPGIPQADQARVFDRFFRASRPDSASGSGLGLGLSLAQEIIMAHRGRLLLKESRPGRTCFTVCLKQDPLSTPELPSVADSGCRS